MSEVSGVPTLVGKYFHSFDGEDVHWQGQIIESHASNNYMVQLFDWIIGAESNRYLVHIDAMRDWAFYSSDEEMNEAYQHKKACPPTSPTS